MTTYAGEVPGDLILNKGDDATAVTSIGGYLDVREDATCDLPALTSIGGSLYVSADATCDLPALTSIGGFLDVSEGATCDLPALTSIRGFLYVSADATCDLPALTSIGGYPVPDPAVASERLSAIARTVIDNPAVLDMSKWHGESGGCGTTHCIAGWAVHLDLDGYALEEKVGSTLLAGNILLGAEASKLFFASKDTALRALRATLDEQVA